MSSLLLITRDAGTQALAERALITAGHDVIATPSSDAAIRALFNVAIDAAIVDTAIGEEEVRSFAAWRRDAGGDYPMVFLAPASVRWMVDWLPLDPERDGVVVKPCEAKELRHAVEACLESAGLERPEVLSIGELALDRSSHELRGESGNMQLTPTEFRLLDYLAQRKGRIVPTDELLEKVWEFYPGTGSSELVRSHIRNLRGKLRTILPGEDLVQTVPRRGYRLQ